MRGEDYHFLADLIAKALHGLGDLSDAQTAELADAARAFIASREPQRMTPKEFSLFIADGFAGQAARFHDAATRVPAPPFKPCVRTLARLSLRYPSVMLDRTGDEYAAGWNACLRELFAAHDAALTDAGA